VRERHGLAGLPLALWVNLSLATRTMPNEEHVAAARFHQALDLMRHGKPLPAEPPPTEGTTYGFVSVYPGKGTEHRSDG
jgi:hypothetical protein